MTGRESAGANGKGVRRAFVLVFGVALLVVVGVLAYSWLSEPGVWSLGSEGTARQAYAAASKAAAQWQEDARLSAVSGQRVAIGAQSEAGSEWAFQFFSPSTGRLALITVEDEAARVIRDALSPYSIPTFAVGLWRVDSDQAFQVWWDSGGASMVAQRDDVDLVMQLDPPGDEGEHPIWTVTGLIAGTQSAFSTRVDATEGTVVAGP